MSIDRRAFTAWLAAATLLPVAAHAAGRPPRRRASSHRMKPAVKLPLLKPPRLRQGDTVALIAPGGYATEKSIVKARANIEKLGFRVREGAFLREVNGNYAGTAHQRLLDLHAAFADPEIRMIWPIRGGSGCISLLAHLDFALIRANPKILLGYSDITALHLAIYKHARLVSFHGPVASSTLTDYAIEQMMAVLGAPQPRYTIPMAPENSRRALLEPEFAIRT
ncbi:MAG: LD-carboxypeptidase, partial [Massilia sp.]|nr:LD-carboxypeptidase [Massilia sp.]